MRNESAAEPVVARDATYYRAPDALRSRIQAMVSRDARANARPALWRWGGFAAAIAAACVVTWNAALMHAQTATDEAIARDVTTAHVRSLMTGGHLNDVESTDQHTVKPWFQGKVDFAPRVVDLASNGFALEGGRLDYVNGRPVAALTYRYRLHAVNVFQWPIAGPDAQPELVTRNGFSLAHWRRGGMEFWAVSDAAGTEVLRLAQALAAS
jgi:anti-sigma factor RsiW